MKRQKVSKQRCKFQKLVWGAGAGGVCFSSYIRSSLRRFLMTGRALLSLITKVINRTCTMSYWPTSSAGGSINISHLCILIFEGSRFCAGAWTRLMSNPSNWTVEGRLWARSISQILFWRGTEENKPLDAFHFLFFSFLVHFCLPCSHSYIRNTCARFRRWNIRMQIKLKCRFPQKEL